MITSLSKVLIRMFKGVETRISKSEMMVEQLPLSDSSLSYINSLLNESESSINSSENFVKKMSAMIPTMSRIVNIITSLPVPTGPAVPIGVITKLSQKLIEVNDLVKSINIVLPIYVNLIANYRLRIANVRSKMLLNSEVSDTTIDNSLSNGQMIETKVSSDFDNIDFYLVSEKTVYGVLRHYAVARSNNRNIVRTEYSYTLNPSVLIYQLKTLIENNGQ